MTLDDRQVTRSISRVALGVALLVALALPLCYVVIAYLDFSSQLDFKAKVKANALSGLITSSPDTWMFAENRLQGLLAREPVLLKSEVVHVYDHQGTLVSQVGKVPSGLLLRRSQWLYDATRQAGRLEVSDSIKPVLTGSAIAAALGALLGTLVFVALRTLPLRALRRVSEALFEQRQRAEVTLHSIGDAVITTDAHACIEFLNPVAEAVSGWTLAQARGRPLSEVLRLVDATTEGRVTSAMPQALRENRIVSFGREIDLIRPDGSRIGVDDSAAPIHDSTGAVSGGVLIIRDVSTARSLARQRSWEAAHDSLTGLPNRREFARLIEAAVDSARDEGKQHVVCYMDLDQFKVVNDTCGHTAGDELLQRVTELLASHIRESDTLARLGGDEFGLLLEGCSIERAELISADLLAAVGDFRFQWEGKTFGIGVSIGMALVAGDSNATEVLATADTACYWAKEQGRSRVCIYRRGDHDLEARRRQVGWVARIHSALAEDRFVLYQQRFLPLTPAAGTDAHLEVLIRMRGDDGELIHPGSFLPAAERYNLMPAIDRWVIGTVFARYREVAAAQGGGPLVCAINLSATTLNAEGLLDFVREQARLHALPAGAVCFEITETSAINNLRLATQFMHDCKALGFLFALDDFGSGMSSFGYLKNLPVDFLKIDGSFVRNLAHDAIDRAMTEAINAVGHTMGIRTVAEYAESEAIIQALRSMGVDYAQGYGVCRPSPLFKSDETERETSSPVDDRVTA